METIRPKEIRSIQKEKLVFRSDIELISEGTLPCYEMKTKLIKKLY